MLFNKAGVGAIIDQGIKITLENTVYGILWNEQKTKIHKYGML